MSVYPRQLVRFTPAEIAWIGALRVSGMPWREIATLTGRRLTTLYRRFLLCDPVRGQTDISHLSGADVAAIKTLFVAGRSYRDTARAVGQSVLVVVAVHARHFPDLVRPRAPPREIAESLAVVPAALRATVERPCPGPLCRGQRMHRSTGFGDRLCHACRVRIAHICDGEEVSEYALSAVPFTQGSSAW